MERFRRANLRFIVTDCLTEETKRLKAVPDVVNVFNVHELDLAVCVILRIFMAAAFGSIHEGHVAASCVNYQQHWTSVLNQKVNDFR